MSAMSAALAPQFGVVEHMLENPIAVLLAAMGKEALDAWRAAPK